MKTQKNCETSLLGYHLMCPDEVGFDLETKHLEYFCLRCGELIRKVHISNFLPVDYEILFHILTKSKDTEKKAKRKSLIDEISKDWYRIFEETIDITLGRI